jgi:hypothetical protein
LHSIFTFPDKPFVEGFSLRVLVRKHVIAQVCLSFHLGR